MSKLLTKDIIRYSAYIVKHEGYVKRSESESNCTVERVLDAMALNEISDKELESVRDRIDGWLKYINDPNNTGEYFDSLRAEVVKPTIDESKVGLIASSFSSFDKHSIYEKKRELDKQSQYIGEEGDVVTIAIKDYRLVKFGNSKFNNGSKWYLYNIRDINGNIIVWFADDNYDSKLNNHCKITASITKLSEYNGVKQTTISKVNFCNE